MPDKELILKVLKTERECVERQIGSCDRNCSKCDLYLPDNEILLKVYDFLIASCELKECKIDISKEDLEKFKEVMSKQPLVATPLNRTTFDGHRLGEIVVSDEGIDKIVDVDGYAGYTAETIMPKEVFIEAYKKYIKGDTE